MQRDLRIGREPPANHLAGTPPTMEYGSTSFVTTACAATIDPRPIRTPAMITARYPTQTSSSITVRGSSGRPENIIGMPGMSNRWSPPSTTTSEANIT